MTQENFVHLHNHTEYSMLDGAARIEGLTSKAAELGMPAVGISDHGTMFGLYEFWKTARKNSIKPIIGVEAYVTPGTHRVDRSRVNFGDGGSDDVSQSGAYTHMTMWARTTKGMHNMFRMGSLASLEGFFYEPRMDRELLQTYSEGLVATTGCPSGEVQTYLRFGKYEQARHAAAEFQDIFGKENYYLELMDHGLHLERRVRDDLLRLAKDLKMPLLATNDIHYLHESDAHSHEALLCVGGGSTLLEPTREQGGKRFAFGGSGYYLKSAQEMRHLFRDLPEACDNTLLLAEQCEVDFVEQEGRYMPHFPTPDGEDETSFFVKEVERGLHQRFSGSISDEARQRATLETDVIVSKGYAGYYLVVADFIRWAKAQGIRVGPGRGSGPGSLAAYALGITDLDPIRHRLFFERFLNPERMSMPDFDIDFDDTRRAEVINYVSERYGRDAVAQIVTYGTIKAKAAIKDATRVTGKPFMLGEQMSKALPPDVMGNPIALADTQDPEAERYDEAGSFRELLEAKPEAQEVYDLAQQLEGLKRQWGVHAAGVVISSDPLLDVLPIMRRSRDGAILTQFDYPTCEALGLVKMDFLGLRTLTTIEHAVENIRRNGKTPPEIGDGPMDDGRTYDLLTKGETQAVFQLEGGGMRSLLRMVRPNRFEDIAAVVALYRPGPMGTDTHTNYALRKNKRQSPAPIHPELAEPLADILDDTHGLLVFQEQVMEIAQKVAGYSLGEADLLRRAMGKKKKEVLDAEYPKFRGGMQDKGFSDDSIETLWKTLVPFSDYAFNRCGIGSTEVYLGSSGSDSNGRITLEELYRRLHVNLLPPRRRGDPVEHEGPCLHCQREDRPAVWRGRCKACKSWWIKFRNSGLTALSVDTDGRIRPRRIKDVHHNGTREVFRVTLSDGKSITTTANHRHMTPRGWVEVRDLVSGQDALMVMGDDAQKSYRKYDYRLSSGKRNYEKGEGYIGGQRSESPGYANGGSLALKEWTETQQWACDAPGCERTKKAGDRIERAHLDGDRANNDPLNLRMLCASHHKQHDYEANGRLRRWEAGKPVVPVEVVSVEPAGVEDVYDLEMDAPEAGDSDGPERSWVGNGIVTHNSHAAAYGVLSYWTAYLKTHFPAEYMAAVLTGVASDKAKLGVQLAECRRMGIRVLPPDVNESAADFAASGEDIRVGLRAVRNVGHNVVVQMITARQEKGKASSFEDFVRKTGVTTKTVMESLIKAGAFDSMDHGRQGLMLSYQEIVGAAANDRRAARGGEDSLFGEDSPREFTIPELEWDSKTLLSFEREMLGLYVSGHPLDGREALLERYADHSAGDIIAVGGAVDDSSEEDGPAGADDGPADGTEVSLAGLLTHVENKVSKKGENWAKVTLEDFSGAVECLVFPRTLRKVSGALVSDSVVWIGGKVSRRDDPAVVFVDDVRPLND